MNYKKLASQVLKNFYSNKKVLMDASDPTSVLVCFDGIMIVRFPEIYFPFNSGMFENAKLWKIIDGVKNDCVPGVKTNKIIARPDGKRDRLLYEIFDEMRRLTYIDSKLYDMLDCEEPVFLLSTKSDYGPVLVTEEQFPDQVKAVLMPVRI